MKRLNAILLLVSIAIVGVLIFLAIIIYRPERQRNVEHFEINGMPCIEVSASKSRNGISCDWSKYKN